MPTHKLTAEILNAAIVGFEQQKLRIDAQIAELRQMLGGGPTATAATPAGPRGKRRKMSAAARKRIGDAQRKRWAESKKESAPSSPVAPEAAKPKRKLSAAGRKAIAEATRKRWARVKAEAATAAKAKQAPAAKKAARSERESIAGTNPSRDCAAGYGPSGLTGAAGWVSLGRGRTSLRLQTSSSPRNTRDCTQAQRKAPERPLSLIHISEPTRPY